LYVVDLVAKGVVNTMPEPTLHAVDDHGVITGDSVTGHYVDAQQVLDDLAAVGVDYDDVVQVLEDEAIEKFENSWNELIESIQGELDKLGAEVASGGASAGSKK
jgi:transaldolase